MNDIPTEQDWRSAPWMKDTAAAHRQFLGRSAIEASNLFGDDTLARQAELCSMPVRCFEYYTKSYMIYLRSDRSCGDSGGAACFLSAVDDRLTDIMKFGSEYVTEIIDMLEYVRENSDWFETNSILLFRCAARSKRLGDFLRSILANRAG